MGYNLPCPAEFSKDGESYCFPGKTCCGKSVCQTYLSFLLYHLKSLGSSPSIVDGVIEAGVVKQLESLLTELS